MDTGTIANILLVLLFLAIGGVFAGTEVAIVSLRESQVKRTERSGRKGARTAALVRDPNLFLSAVQIGVTVAGFFSSAYGASTLAPDIAPRLRAGRPVHRGRGDRGADWDDPGHRLPLPRPR
ncbi:CNNM domain-containing protein [Kocuria sp. NPDC057446]|uniref:CNNM domain-containing protein n=1 Tax=Kocuria sp. NPDC057446 TaxID=3346137 RepID=UPI0036BD5EA3